MRALPACHGSQVSRVTPVFGRHVGRKQWHTSILVNNCYHERAVHPVVARLFLRCHTTFHDLNGCRFSGSGAIKGTIYLPPGKSVRGGIGGCDADVHNLPWSNLYQLAVKWGLIEETPAAAR